MCFATPRPVVNQDPQSRAVKAAGDQAIAARKDAFGYGQALLGGLNTANPGGSVSRQMLLGTGS